MDLLQLLVYLTETLSNIFLYPTTLWNQAFQDLLIEHQFFQNSLVDGFYPLKLLTKSTKNLTISGFVSGKTPCPKLNIYLFLSKVFKYFVTSFLTVSLF